VPTLDVAANPAHIPDAPGHRVAHALPTTTTPVVRYQE
jgi:hypothetical protein